MGKIVVKGHTADAAYLYKIYKMSFSLVSSPKNGREQCMVFLSCRDYVHEAIRAYVQTDSSLSYHYSPDNDPPMDMERLRLLIVRDFDTGEDVKVFKEKLFNAKRIINFYERIAGWDRSKIATVNHTVKEYVWLLTGPKEWVSYPNLLSMLTLILRAINKYGPVEFKDNWTLEKEYKRIITAYDAENTRDQWHDISYLGRCYKKFHFLMKYNKELFTADLKETYPPRVSPENHNFHGQGGIVSLCSFKAVNAELNKKFRELWEKYIRTKTEEEEKDVQKEFHNRYRS